MENTNRKSDNENLKLKSEASLSKQKNHHGSNIKKNGKKSSAKDKQRGFLEDHKKAIDKVKRNTSSEQISRPQSAYSDSNYKRDRVSKSRSITTDEFSGISPNLNTTKAMISSSNKSPNEIIIKPKNADERNTVKFVDKFRGQIDEKPNIKKNS